MDLRDAMIDEARSAPLARGRMTLHSAEAGAISTLAGAHEVFCFQRDDFAITISSVLSHAINVRGFHRATLAYPKLTMTLPIQASLRPLTTLRSSAFSGGRLGRFEYGPEKQEIGSWERAFAHDLERVEFDLALDRDGVTLTVRAILGEAARNGLEQTGAPMSAGSRVEAIIEFSWATVFLCMPELCWERAPIVRNETTKTTAVEPGLDDPRSLLGLKIDGLTANAYIPGRFTKALPFVSGGPARNEALVSLGIMPSIILFGVPWWVERLSNGFYRSRLSEWQLELSQVGWEWLERVLRQDDRAEMTLQGVGIGHLDNLSEFGYSATDNRGSLRQPIETFTIKAELTDDGIDISVTGSLGDIDPRTAGGFRATSAPAPRRTFRDLSVVPLRPRGAATAEALAV